MPHIVATVSGHGFGHLSISAPVLNRLCRDIPELRLTIISGLPRERLRTRIRGPFTYQHSVIDSGVAMDPDLSVRVNETADTYRRLHDNWNERIRDYAGTLKLLDCDLVLSNVSCLSLAAAKHQGLPAVAICSLNWADIYHYYCRHNREFGRVHEQMTAAYQSAAVFLKPTPCMPMSELANTRQVGPIAESGTDRKAEICSQLDIDPNRKLVLVAMGGHDLQLSIDWPELDDICWLVSRGEETNHPNVAVFEDLGLPFLDLLASCDLLIGKPGYGSFTEAACMGKPVLYILRPDWPEEHYLVQWLKQQSLCKELTPRRLRNSEFVEDVLDLLNDDPLSARPEPAGVSEAVAVVRQLLNH